MTPPTRVELDARRYLAARAAGDVNTAAEVLHRYGVTPGAAVHLIDELALLAQTYTRRIEELETERDGH